MASPNFLKMVLDEQRHLSKDLAIKTAQILGFNKSEKEFFLSLVQFNKAKSPGERLEAVQSLRKVKEFKQALIDESSLFDYYSDSVHVVLRELCTIRPMTLEEMERSFRPRVERGHLMKALETLERLGLLQRQGERWEVKDAHLATKNKVTKAAVYKFHQDMIAKGAQSIDLFPASEREVTCVTTKLSAESFRKIQQKISDLKEQILFLSEQDQAADRIYQVNFQMFPLTNSSKDKV